MREKSRGCYCASTLCMICEMLIIGAGLVILYMIASDKSELGRKMSSSTVAPGQPIPPPPPRDGRERDGRERDGRVENTDANDLWYLLVMIIGGGLLITVLGFLCSNCAILCCTKRRNSISDSESNQK